MMNAKEMFEELGYEIGETDEIIVEYWKNEKNVCFWLVLKDINLFGNIATVSIELHNAIHQQMKELGWIE